MNETPHTPSPSPQGDYIPFAFPGLPKVGCAFTTALAGNMSFVAEQAGENVAANRHRIMSTLGLRRWVEFHQVHGTEFLIEPEPAPPEQRIPALDADGGCTGRKGLALLIKTADCQPILFTDKSGRAVAALHAGWRGNAAGYPGIGLTRFCETFSIGPEEVLAVRGPSLGRAEFIHFEREWPAQFTPWFDAERRSMDLWSLLRRQLIEAGMLPEHIFSLDLCTQSLPGLFFSHRRGDRGRQLSLIWIRED